MVSKHRTRVGKATSKTKDLIQKGPRNGSERGVTRKAAASDVTMKDTRVTTKPVEIKVTGWTHSKASDSRDSGAKSLIKWLEKKASLRLGSKPRDVRIKKSRIEGDDLFVTVLEQDEVGVLRLNGFAWAGTKLRIQRAGAGAAPASESKTEQTKAMLRGVLERRYNPDIKLLDLSALGQDEELRAQAIFDTKSTASKFFPAMMRVLELSFDTLEERNAAVQSVTLANNDLENLTIVTTLSHTLPKLKNLDLSHNKFETLDALSNWRRRFYHLQQLILSDNPLEQREPTYAAEIVKWYPNLLMLNNIQVRTEEDVAKACKVDALPFPIRGANFSDEGGIAETFVRNFFAGIDGDRQALVSFYYDEESELSLAVNTSAPRDPSNSAQAEKLDWGDYIQSSRNLKRLTQTPARVNRLMRGTSTIGSLYAAIPQTKHPDLASEPSKWLIEASVQPGVPDISGHSPSGVDGFLITVHGEFTESDPATAAPTTKKRSFDHTFSIGPNASGGVRIHRHQFIVRAYGGPQAFEPHDLDAWETAVDVVGNGPLEPGADTQLAAGLTVEMAEQMVIELGKQTNMNPQYSKDCLEQVAWDFGKALNAFEAVKASLPAEAFV